ncbi:MAG: peptidyl-prolyl cis-trans isomerase [candidate division WOR-3 bacterium]|nr:peptidyl-prolyl cis-trans isomerase [candidate division WOR-3 bacterium]MCX7836876.1 peptidyl-prolyl cis-trans isomerase [candidate division WOR-3 bacterium]MDW8114421.1 peptidylprolyl isomerase [candidate division WOR-3 bacterium]
MISISKIRKNMRTIMLIVAIAFVGGFLMSELWIVLKEGRFGENPVRKGILGYVGKKPIKLNEYQNILNYITYKYLRTNRLKDISEEERIRLQEEAWRYLVDNKIWQDIYIKNDITVTNEELFEIMKANPPEELKNSPEFKDSLGNFDYQKYHQVLTNPENQAYFAVYAQELLDFLPKEKFRLDLQAAIHIPSKEAEFFTQLQKTRIVATYIFIPLLTPDDTIPIPEKELKAYYEKKKKKDFKIPKNANLKYIEIPITLTSSDSNEAKSIIDDAYNELKKGEDFGITMIGFSELLEDTAGIWYELKNLDSITKNILKDLKPNEFSEPFLKSDTWKIVQLREKKGDSLKIRSISVRIKISPTTIEAILDTIEKFREAAKEEIFDSVAFKYFNQYPRPITITEGRPPFWLRLASPNQIEEFAFNSKIGSISPPLLTSTSYIVAYLEKINKESYQPFERIKTSLTYQLRREKAKENKRKIAEDIRAILLRNENIGVIQNRYPFCQIGHKEDFMNFDFTLRSRGPEFAGALYSLNPGEVSPVIELDWGFYVIKCEERNVVGEISIDNYREQKTNQFIQYFWEELTKKEKIKDFRHLLYTRE